MKLIEILNSYQIETLEQLAANKIQDIDHIRLPKEVLVEELNTYLQKYPYIQKIISLRNPPSFLILSKIIDSPDHKISISGFKETIKKDGTMDYQKLKRPAVIRKQEEQPKSIKNNSNNANPDMDYLDIPAFLRRQEEV